MVFLVEDFVNLPADQIGNIWLAAHMKRKLQKKDIKKTKVGSACDQLHSDKTKKPMQLRHYGQCLIGLSWIHYKQVEYLHNDCNDAFSKARLVLVRRRNNVDLDPSRQRANDITLPEAANTQTLELDSLNLNDSNLSQLYLDDGHGGHDMESLLGGSAGGNRDDLAADHEITMPDAHTSISPDRLAARRSSFGGISSLLMGDIDIEIKFDDDDDNNAIGAQILDESQAQRSNLNSINLTDNEDDDNMSIEHGRGGILHQQQDPNMSHQHISSIAINPALGMDDAMSADGAGSHISYNKDVVGVDALSAVGTASDIGLAANDAMDLDIVDVEGSVHSIEVDFDDAASAASKRSIATAQLEHDDCKQIADEATPPPPVAAVVDASSPNAKNKQKRVKKKGGIGSKKRRKKFGVDRVIELESDALRARDMKSADFVYAGGRDALHIWRERALAELSFEELVTRPLSKLHFGEQTDVAKYFAVCNGDGKQMSAKTREDGLAEMGRQHVAGQGLEDEMMDGMDGMDDLDMEVNGMDHVREEDDGVVLAQEKEKEMERLIDNSDNVSTLSSVVDDALPAPHDPLFDADMSALPLPDEEVDEEGRNAGKEEADDDDDEDGMDMHELEKDSGPGFEPGDENVLTQMNDVDVMPGVKPRDWSRRARKTFSFFKKKEGREFSFNELMKNQTKKDTVVGVFYELLVFKNSDLVDLKQEEAYGDITITKTDNFYKHEKMSQRLSQRLSGV